MQCLFCHKKLSRLRIWKRKSEFCCDEHADTYKKQTLERLLRDQEQLLQKVSAPPLPISDHATDDGLDAILARGDEAEGLDRSRLLPSPEPAGANLDAAGNGLSETTPAESLNDIVAPRQQGGTLDDVRQQTPEDVLETQRRPADVEHSPVKPPDNVPDAGDSRGAAKDEPLGPWERLASWSNADAPELPGEAASGSDITSEGDPEQVGADAELGQSETAETAQEPGDTLSMLERLMEAGRADESRQVLQEPATGKSLELDSAPAANESVIGENDAGGIDSVAEADAASSPTDESEPDAPAAPLWLREFQAETSAPRGGASAAAHADSREKAPQAGSQTTPQGDKALPANNATETEQPADELEPGDWDVDRVAAAEELTAITDEDHRTLDSLLDGLARTAENGAESSEGGASLTPGEADVALSARKVVSFPGPDERPRFKDASSQEFAEINEPPEVADSSSSTPQRWAPWLEMMNIEPSAQELAESDAPTQGAEAADVIAPPPASRFHPPAMTAMPHAGLSVWDAIWGRDGTDSEGDLFTLRLSGSAPEGFLGHQEDMSPASTGHSARLPCGEPWSGEFTFRVIPAAELTPAGQPQHASEVQEFALDKSESVTLLIAGTAIRCTLPTLRPVSPWGREALVGGLLGLEPRVAESTGEGLLQQQAEMAVPTPELQSPNRSVVRTPLKPIACSGLLEIFEGLWLPAPQPVDLAEQIADRMHADLIRSKVECRLSSLVDTRYGLSVSGCHMPPHRLLRFFWSAWADPPQLPAVDEGQSRLIAPPSAMRTPEAVYRGINRGRAAFARVERLLMARMVDERAAMAREPHMNLDNLKAGLANADWPLADFAGEVRDWRAEPIGPLLALHGPENLDPCEYA